MKETFPKLVLRISKKELLESSIIYQHLLTRILRGDVGKLKKVRETMPTAGKLYQSQLVEFQGKSFWKAVLFINIFLHGFLGEM